MAKADLAPKRFTETAVEEIESELIDGPEAPLKDWTPPKTRF
jgi:hypothetical protein